MGGNLGRKKKKSSNSSRKTRRPLVINHAKSVESAVKEFDRLGRRKFLEKHGFGQAVNYFLRLNGRLYDSKAICGVAYGKENPTYGPLKRWQFSAGEKTVERQLTKLGFKVVHIWHTPQSR